MKLKLAKVEKKLVYILVVQGLPRLPIVKLK